MTDKNETKNKNETKIGTSHVIDLENRYPGIETEDELEMSRYFLDSSFISIPDLHYRECFEILKVIELILNQISEYPRLEFDLMRKVLKRIGIIYNLFDALTDNPNPIINKWNAFNAFVLEFSNLYIKKYKKCFACGIKQNLKKCGGCKRAYYCSIECQKKDRIFHKEHCFI